MGVMRMMEQLFGPENMIRFSCPIFSVEVEARTCFKLNNLYAVGQPHPKRAGCTACMAAGKCPIPHMAKAIAREGADPFFSAEPKVARLPKKILERIAPVVVLDSTMQKYGCSPAETRAISGALVPLGEKVPEAPRRRRSAVAETEPVASDAVAAAASGDMSAAVTAAVKKEAKPTVTEPTGKGRSLLEIARQKKEQSE